MVKENDVVVFMKGTPRSPMCGFSRAVCQILDYHGISEVTAVNVLEDENVRSEIKAYTSWPTIPQVFVKGNFVGGCDIMMDMHKSGELDTLLIREKIIEPKMDERNQHHHVTESSKPPVVAGGNDEPTENSQSKRKD